ncbi:MAG: hypothetical protein KBD83_03495 [Gammaproteobacteria bacterium]|nr:hypothetical protein [Gammaproteobacteria bacterium]
MQIQMTQYLQSIDFTREIPGYADMSAENKLRYEALYKQAVNPELSPLPEGVSDLEALVYFSIQYLS